jgi:hypothetical protein
LSLASQRIGHPAALFRRNFLHLGPPLSHFGRGEPEFGSQQQ